MSSSPSDAQTTSNNDDQDQKVVLLRAALLQFPVTENKEENHATAREFLKRAAAGQKQQQSVVHMAVLPEIWNSPYAVAAFGDYAEPLPEVVANEKKMKTIDADKAPSAALLQKAAVEHKMWIVGGSIPERVVVLGDGDGDQSTKIYNTCLVFNPEGRLVAKHRKVHLFDIDVPGGITFRESDTLSPGRTVTYFDTPAWGRIGIGICYDVRFAEYAMLLTQIHGCRVLIYPGAFNMTTGPAHWELLQRARALDNQCFVLTVSPARSSGSTTADTDEDHAKKKAKRKYPPYTAWGHSSAVSPWGKVIATTEEKEDVVIVDLDLNEVDKMRQSIPVYQQKRTDLYKVSEA